MKIRGRKSALRAVLWVGAALILFPFAAMAQYESFVDTDGDGLPDSWEGEQFSDPVHWTRCLDYTVFDSDQDPDGDGLTSLQEYNNNQNPTNPCIANTAPPQCSNGVDDEGDGLIDYPDDPDCLSPTDNAELKPQVVGAYYAMVYNLAVKGDYAYLDGLEMLDISDPTNPVRYTKHLIGNPLAGVYGNYAYINRGYNSRYLEIIDISDPANPFQAGSFDVIKTIRSPIVVIDHYIYVQAGVSELKVLDITDPLSPVLVGSVPNAARFWDAWVLGDRIYYAQSDGFASFDVSDRTHPVRFNGANYVLDGRGIFADDNFIYLATHSMVYIYKNARPALRVSMIPTDEAKDYYKDVYAVGNYLFVSNSDGHFNQLDILDISNPAAPRKIWTGVPMTGGIYSIAVQGNYAYLGGLGTGPSPGLWGGKSPGGFYVLDVNGPDADGDGAYDYWECDPTDPNNWNSCDTCVDQDGDGVFTGCDDYLTIPGPDCDDTDASVYPGAQEILDGHDNQCPGDDGFGLIDEGCVGACVTRPGNGGKFNGNLMLVTAGICVGDPADASMIELQWRPAGQDAWNQVTAKTNNGGKELSRQDPLAVHWDVSGLTNGVYQLRAVAYGVNGAADPNPAGTEFYVQLNKK